MTPSQIETANFILDFLHRNGGFANFNAFGSLYVSRFGYERDRELYTVLRILTDDEELIAEEPNDFYRLTAKGAKMAEKGYGKFEQNRAIKKNARIAKDVIAMIISFISLIVSVIALLK